MATGAKYVGKEIDVENICSVSILRSGGVFEAVSQKDAKTLREDH